MNESTTDRQECIPHFRQDVVRRARILVIGAGATGNEVLKNLALTGFGHVLVCDMDVISTSNLSRTVLFTADDLGQPKAATAAARFTAMNIDGGSADFLEGDACSVLGEGFVRHCDLVINCVDNVQTRLYVAELCKRLKKPCIDLGIEALDWNVFISSPDAQDSCYGCLLSREEEAQSLSRVRNSCDVTRLQSAQEGHIPTIGVSSAAAAAFAAEEAIRILHQLHAPSEGFLSPRYGSFFLYDSRESVLRHIRVPRRLSCEHHEAYPAVRESPFSAHMTLGELLRSLNAEEGQPVALSLYKEAMADRGFVTTARCKHCRAPLRVYKPLPLTDAELLCGECCGAPTLYPSEAELKLLFTAEDEILLDLSLTELGIPEGHILEMIREDGSSFYVELSADTGKM